MALDPVSAVANAFSSLLGLGSELIEDKDKRNEFNYKMFELQQQVVMTLATTTTTPWVDALVKLLYAVNSLWRPIVGASMTIFGAYMHFKGTPMDTTAQVIFDGAFPAWGVSRHIEKRGK